MLFPLREYLSAYSKNFLLFHFSYMLFIIRFTSFILSSSGKPQPDKTTPISDFSALVSFCTSFPYIFMFPPSFRAAPVKRFIIVLFPAPFSPISPIMLPSGMLKDTLFSVKFLYFFESLSISTAFITIPPHI